jgi:single-strand DNA-binding protein
MFQRIILAGNLGKKPELRYTQGGQAVTNLSVATNRKWNTDAGLQEETTWFRVTLWGKQAENACKYLDKGRAVLVEGRIQPDENGNPRTWTDNQGVVRANFEVTATSVKYLPGGDRQQPSGGGDGFDDVPFLEEDVNQSSGWDALDGAGV